MSQAAATQTGAMKSETVVHMEIEDHSMALCRMLGVLRRREFDVVALEARSHEGKMQVRATLRGTRNAQTLARQIKRMLDVQMVTMVDVCTASRIEPAA